MTNFACVVCGPNNERFVFEVALVVSESPATHGLEENFYWNASKKAPPQGTHHELEVLAVPPKRDGVPMHVHKNPTTGRTFVCYVPRVPTVEDAKTMFTTWSLGTAYALVAGTDFVGILRDVKPADGQTKDAAFVLKMCELGYTATLSVF